jgi:hypothetical protein
MSTKSLLKSGAVLLVLAFSLVVVPALNTAERSPRISFRLLMNQPSQVLTLLIPWVGMGQNAGLTASTGTQPMAPVTGRKRPTDTMPIQRPGGGD